MQCTLMYIEVMIKKDGRPVKVVTNKPTLFFPAQHTLVILYLIYFLTGEKKVWRSRR